MDNLRHVRELNVLPAMHRQYDRTEAGVSQAAKVDLSTLR
jgi:hypothetical protein